MERTLEKIVGQIDKFLTEAKGTQTSLQLIKMTAMVEDGRQIVQQLELGLKVSTKPGAAALKMKLAEHTATLRRQERQLSEIKDKVILRAGESSSYISDDSDEESKTLLYGNGDEEDSAGFISGRRGNSHSYR